MSDLTELLDLEHAGWKSLCTGDGAKFYGGIMDKDALMIVANGDVMTRKDVVASLASAPPWKSYSIDKPSIVDMGPGCAALVYTGTGRRDGGPPFVGTMTSVYRRVGSDWRLALYQQTAVDRS